MSRLRLPIGQGGTATEDEAPVADGRSSGIGVGRKLLGAIGIAGAAYLAVRLLRSSGDDSEGADAAGGESASEPAGASSQDAASAEGAEPIENVSAEERSPEEIAERVGEDVDAKPAEPGEMAIDESIVEDAVDEAELSTADDGEDDEEGTS